MLFGKKKKVINVGGQSIELEPKPAKLPFFSLKPKPKAPQPPAQPQQRPAQQPVPAPQPSVAQPAPQPVQRPQPTQVQPAQQPRPQQPKPAAPRKPLFSFGKPKQPAPQPSQPRPPAFAPQSPQKIIDVKPSMGLGDINIYKKQEQPKPERQSIFEQPGQQQRPAAQPRPQPQRPVQQPQQMRQRPQQPAPGGPSTWKLYLASVASRHKGLEDALRKQGIKGSVTEFVQRMMVSAAMMSVVIGISIVILLIRLSLPAIEGVVFGILMGIAIFYVAFNSFLNFPSRKGRQSSKIIERDILFATRDMIISLRSGMPLFNALTAVSTGYGEASKEFQKIIEKVQLGTPLEESIDQTVAESKSSSFRRIMLQAAVSIKAGADVVAALQSVIDQLAQERIIELRRYGQRLNALAMFYMLFGIILPSMGIAVATILTTFISIFTVTPSVLAGAIVGIIFLQIIFLQLIRASRPVFAM
ncbi:MAG: type II secretion system F family protein [Candidatus Micrarchaeota archaeon]|nr:type II secretion system F family protein [Candidatus Micrarchaeota archaeon]